METSTNLQTPPILTQRVFRLLQNRGIHNDVVRYLPAPTHYAAKIPMDWQPDYTITTFTAAQKLSLRPHDIAITVAEILHAQDFIKKATPAGPYINFAVTDDFIGKLLQDTCSSLMNTGVQSSSTAKILFDIGKPVLGQQPSASLVSILRDVGIFHRVLEKYGHESELVVRLGDWGAVALSSVASSIHGEATNPSDPHQFPLRKLRKLSSNLQLKDSVEYLTYQDIRQNWLKGLTQTARTAASAAMTFVGDSEVAPNAKSAFKKLTERMPEQYKKDPDSQAVYFQEEHVIPLVTHDGQLTDAGHNLGYLVSRLDSERALTVVYAREHDTLLTPAIIKSALRSNDDDNHYVRVTSLTESNLRTSASPEQFDQDALQFKELRLRLEQYRKRATLKTKNLSQELSGIERQIATKLLHYETALKEAADSLSVHPANSYFSTITQLAAQYIVGLERSEIESNLTAQVIETLSIVLKDISTILAID